MPKKTVYVREEEIDVWSRAEKLSEVNLSALLGTLLREFVSKKEAESMYVMSHLHGPVTKRMLYVWGSRDDEGRSAWGTSFDSAGLGLEQAQALMGQMKSDPSIANVQLEERRVYKDKWVDREPLEEWTRTETGWIRAR